MNTNDLTLIIKGTTFIFDTIDRVKHFLDGYNAASFHSSMDKLTNDGHFDNEEDVHAMLEEEVYGKD